jgi:hypothetical protein
MVAERVRVDAALQAPDPKIAAWTEAAMFTMAAWTTQYPGLATDALKNQMLADIYATTRRVEAGAPGYMAWFEKQHPGVAARMVAELNRIKGVAPDAVRTTGQANYSSPTTDPKVVEGYNWLVAAWRSYGKLADDTKKRAAMTAFLSARASADGRKVWDYARTNNAALTLAIDKEAQRLSLAKVATGTNYGARTSVKGLDEYVLKAQQYRDAAKILRADNMQRASVNMRLTRMMGR